MRPVWVLAVLAPLAARADQGVDAQLYKPALDPYGVFSIERVQGLPQYDVAARLSATFTTSPLALSVPITGSDEILSSQLTLDFGFAFGVTDWLTFAFDVPITRAPLAAGYGKGGLYRPVDPSMAQPGTGFYSVRPDQNVLPSENGPGDVRVGVKIRFTGRGDWGIGATIVGYAPFGDEDVFGGSSGATFEPKLVLERRLGTGGFLALNAGVRVREGTLVRTRQTDSAGRVMNDAAGDPVYFPLLYVGSEALVGLGARYQFTSAFGAGLESYALIPIAKADSADCSGDCKNGDLTGDVLGGVYLSPSPDVTITIAGGTGISPDAVRRDAFRVTAGVAWTPSSEGSAVQGDRDGDGIPDREDLCPDEPEDKDGFQDADGCPDPDNDGDGILDKDDTCPNEPETVNGFEDFDGCPDQAVQGGPRLALDRIDLQGERIEFVGRSARPTGASQQTLEGVAEVIKTYPSIRFRVEIGVERSGDSRRSREADRRLTAERGRVIAAVLIARGAKPAQLDVAPLGSDRPLDARNPKDPRANRRVEIIRVQQ
jgi:outer membrane protein OmpA-like peptidoglycan-associated protein